MINDYEATKPMTTDAIPVSADVDTSEGVVAKLNELIEICKDGEHGFKEAAYGIEHMDLKTMFMAFSQQRGEFASILQELVRTLGGEPEMNGSFTAAVRRRWMHLATAVSGRDEIGILSECEREEDRAQAAYADVLRTDLPINIADVLKQQSHAITAAHNRIRDLRNQESHLVATPGK